MDVAKTLPGSVQLEGLDIDFGQCPPREWLPKNVELRAFDIFSPVPEELLERFDIISVRHFTMIVRDNDPVPILQTLVKMLSMDPSMWI